MKKKLILLPVLTLGLVFAGGCSKSEHSAQAMSETFRPVSMEPRAQADPQILAMAEKLRAALDRAAEAENLNSNQ